MKRESNMRVLIDISHPAHVHFFRNIIFQLLNEGHVVKVVSRDKDITLELLDLYKIEHTSLSQAPKKKSVLKFAQEMFVHCFRLLRIARKFKPDIMLQIAGTFVAPIGKMLSCPTYIFYDTEFAKLSNAIAYPLATKIFTPSCYEEYIGGKQVRYSGYHELAYLHPDVFSPQKSFLAKNGINISEKFFIVRFVNWAAVHDYKEEGFGLNNKIRLINMLSGYGKVLISSESELPKELEQYASCIPYNEIHHVMAFASLVIGESATMASEAAVLGVPGVFISTTPRGYTTEQESRYGLVYNFKPKEQQECLDLAERIAQSKLSFTQEKYKRRRGLLLKEKINVTKWLGKILGDL